MVEFIDHGQHDEVVFRQGPRGFLLVGGGEDILVRRLHDVVDRRVPGAEGEVAEADFSDEATLLVHHENPGQRLRVIAVAAEHGDGLFHRHVGGDPADVGGHPAAGGVFLVFEQVAGELLVARA